MALACQQKRMPKVMVSPSDISVARRLQKGTRDATHPVLIRFTNRKSRDSVYFAKKFLHNDPSGNKIYISKHLTKDARDISYEARKLVHEKN